MSLDRGFIVDKKIIVELKVAKGEVGKEKVEFKRFEYKTKSAFHQCESVAKAFIEVLLYPL